MAITGLIPQTKMPIDTLNSQLEQLMQQIARHRQTNNQSRQIDETAKYHAQDFALRQAAGKRAQQQMDPMFKLNQIKAMIAGLRGMANGNQQAGGDESGGESMPGMPPLAPDNSGNPGVSAEGPGAIPEGQNPFVGRAGYKAPKGQGGMNDEIAPGITLEDITRHALGLPAKKLPAETPEQKQQRAIETNLVKLQQAEEHQQKVAQQKEIQAVEKDIPTLQESVKGVQDLLKIAKENPDIFGHGFLPDRYAKQSTNKNFGVWQNLIADRIAGLESKLSSKGNIVALKMAAQLKPSHADKQEVAIGKLESMLGQLQRQLQNSMKKTGKMGGEVPKFADDDMVIVEGPNGEETMTYAQAKELGAE